MYFLYLLFLTMLCLTRNIYGSSQVTCPVSCENCPCFTVGPFEFEVEENSPIGMSIATLTATPGSDISYSSESPVFEMDSVTGVLSVGESLDYESQNRYEFRVKATADSYVGRREITVNILNKNEFSPQCSNGLVYFSVLENQNGISFQLPNCTDDDLIAPYLFTYEISSFDNLFGVDDTHVFNILLPLDYETRDLYELIVIVKDANIPPRSLNTTIRVIVTVTPENEYPPVFTSDQYMFEVSESAMIGSLIGTVIATDGDRGNDGQVLYSIISEQTNAFVVNQWTGDIKLVRIVDYETETSYILTVIATDNAADAGSRHSATATINISILDSNDNSPFFASPFYYMDISENAPLGFFLMQFTCVDLDSGQQNRELLYSITSGNNEGYFSIDSLSGNVTLASSLDYDNSENSDLIPLTILCREVALPNRVSSTQFLIAVTSFNAFVPQPTLAEFSVSVTEDTHPGTSILSISATDRDRGSGGLIRYLINNDAMQSQSCPFDKFSIDENSGDIYLLSPLDYEDGRNELHCVVTILDSGYPEKANLVDLFISVTDINDNKPMCFPSASAVHIREDSRIGDIVYSLPCNDTDTSNLQYFIENDFFTISSTGNLILQLILDFETKPFHFLFIQVFDGMFVINATVAVIVEPVNEYIPVFSQPIFYCFVEENSLIGTVLPCNITATDHDDGSDGEIRYRLQSSTSPFSLNSENLLLLTVDIDFESQNEFLSQVEVFDLGNPSLSSTALINLTVLDENDNLPKMIPTLSESVLENSLPQTLITVLLCADADEGSNGETNIQLSEVFQINNNAFLNVSDLFLFSINDSNAEVFVSGEVDYEISSKYRLNFICTDHGTPPLSTSSTLFLDVIPENEHSPVFVNPLLSVRIAEATNVGTVISRVIATDEDAGKDGDLLFSLISPLEDFPFDINSNSGEIVLWNPLNCEQSVHYAFDVIAKDSGVPSQSSQYSTEINVTNCHLGSVIPHRSTYLLSVVENAPTGENVGSVSCSSNRPNIVTSITPLYRLASNDSNNFNVDRSSGDIMVTNPPDFELQERMKIVIECYDPNLMSIASNATVYINVLPKNEFPPTFLRSNLRVNVSENTPIGTSIMQLHATDQDHGLDGQIQFSIMNDDSSKVTVNQRTGEVYLTSTLDREMTNEITFFAIARDLSIAEEMKRSSTALVTVAIKDENDNWPMCTPMVHYVIVSPRTEPPYTIIDTFGCIDNDLNGNAQMEYQFSDHTVPTDLFKLSLDSLLLIDKLNTSSGPSQYSIPISVVDGGIPSFVTNLLVIVDVHEPDQIVGKTNDYAAGVEAEGLNNAILIRLNDITVVLSKSEIILRKFQQIVAASVTHYCALLPEACSLASGCSEFFGAQQKRSVSDSYVVFDEPSIVILSEDIATSSSASTTYVNVVFYVVLPVDGSRSYHRETDYVIPRATLNLIVEQDGSTIEAVVRDGVAQHQPPPNEWMITVSVVSGILGSVLLIAFFLIMARAVKKKLKRNKIVVPTQETNRSVSQNSGTSQRESITSGVSGVSNKATCDDNRLNDSRLGKFFKRKRSESSSALSSKEGSRTASKTSTGAMCDGNQISVREPDMLLEDFDQDSLYYL